MILEHIGITVSDLDRSVAFYTTLFGFRVLRRTPTCAYIYNGLDILDIMQSESPTQAQTPQGADDWLKTMKCQVGRIHIGFRVDDLDVAIEHLEKLGGTLVVPPLEFRPEITFLADVEEEKLIRAAAPRDKPYWRIATFSDPDGIMLEILER
ncbi:MAG: VOC family protein [Anaerolineales bacterium]|nr:VOC family protein [Anaerolineales bacterium]